MNILMKIWQWFLRRNWFIKIWIILILIGSIISIFDKSVDNDSLSVGDCVVDAGGLPINPTTHITAPTSFEIVKCSNPKASAKVLYIEEMYKQDWTDTQWENYALSNCPEMSTSYTYPEGGLSNRFTCWLDETAYGITINLVTNSIESNN